LLCALPAIVQRFVTQKTKQNTSSFLQS